MDKLRVAIVGCGGIANVAHIPAIKQCKELEVVAICDINPAKFDKTLAHIGKNVPTYENYKEMIIKEKPDLVHVCTPNYLHSPISVFALDNGANVLCEKPDSISVEDVTAMKDAEARSGKKLMVMRNNRFGPAAQYAKAMAASGKMGDVYTGRCGWIRRRGIPGRGGWFTTKEQSGGGPLIDLGVHMIDLAMYIMGNPKAVAVMGATYNKFANAEYSSDSKHATFGDAVKGGTFDVEDLAIGFIRFENGASLQIEFSWASNIFREKTFVELRGSKAGINYHGPYGLQVFSGDKRSESLGTRLRKNFVPTGKLTKDYKFDGKQHNAQVKHFVDVILRGATPEYTIDQGINMIKILTGLYKSAESGKEVTL